MRDFLIIVDSFLDSIAGWYQLAMQEKKAYTNWNYKTELKLKEQNEVTLSREITILLKKKRKKNRKENGELRLQTKNAVNLKNGIK